MLALPGIADTVNIDHIKRGYYSMKSLNPIRCEADKFVNVETKETEDAGRQSELVLGQKPRDEGKVAAEITESIVRNTGTDAKYIYVIFEDVAPRDWAGEGKLFGPPTQDHRT